MGENPGIIEQLYAFYGLCLPQDVEGQEISGSGDAPIELLYHVSAAMVVWSLQDQSPEKDEVLAEVERLWLLYQKLVAINHEHSAILVHEVMGLIHQLAYGLKTLLRGYRSDQLEDVIRFSKSEGCYIDEIRLPILHKVIGEFSGVLHFVVPLLQSTAPIETMRPRFDWAGGSCEQR
jgi:hypothetical protein